MPMGSPTPEFVIARSVVVMATIPLDAQTLLQKRTLSSPSRRKGLRYTARTVEVPGIRLDTTPPVCSKRCARLEKRRFGSFVYTSTKEVATKAISATTATA